MSHKTASHAKQEKRPAVLYDCTEITTFDSCRQFLRQFGFIDDRRMQIKLLKQDERLIRELRHLDSQRCRETHKIAIIYIANGQSEKAEILSNSSGSQNYEQFLSGLGWMVNISSHEGFMGGLQRSRSTNERALYFASSTKEVIFHVSTVMPSETEEDRHRKLKHIGNDEVHIVWSEHSRDYHQDIIPTKFGDVIIVIYPLSNGLYKIRVIKKDQLIQFGPLFDGSIVDSLVLPGLVFATAVNASRHLRTNKQYYRTFYEERMSSLSDIASKCLQPTAYDELLAELIAPGFLSTEASNNDQDAASLTPIQVMLLLASEKPADKDQAESTATPKSKSKKSSGGSSSSPLSPRRARSKSTR